MGSRTRRNYPASYPLMSHELPSEKAALTHSEQVRLDEMLDRFEAAWKRWQSGPPPRIEDFAANTSSRLRVELVSEMVKLDREYRDKHAMPKELAEYVRDLPELEGFSTSLPGIPAASPPIASTSPAHRAPKGRRNTTPVRIGPYRIIKKLGGGGQADAYLAVDELLGHEVVIKLSNYPLDGQDPARDRLATEGQILAKLDHTAIVKVYAAGVDEDYPYLVLERVEGQTLEQFVGGGRLSARRAAQLVAQVARGADLANRHGVIHQDINPRNVLIDVFGNAKLIDFGLAYVKDAWQDAIEDIGGTVLYMSPEQAQRQHEQIDRRTDVFGLGALLYYLLTGQAPISGKSREEAFAKATRCDVDVEPLSAPGIPRSLRRICLQAMSRFPNERPASAEELAHQLDRVLARRKFLQLGAAMVAAAIVVPTAWSTFLPTTAVDPQLAIRVLRGETYLPLLNALPIRTLDRVQVCFNVPAGMEATLYTVDALGKPEQVQHWPPKPMQREVTFPSTDQNVEISGPTGTEVIVLCLDPSLDLQVYDLRIPPAPSEEKLQLPDWVIVEAKGNTITAVEQPLPTGQPRGFGTRHDATDPVEGTKERLKQLQTRLQSRCRAWSAVAFGHRV